MIKNKSNITVNSVFKVLKYSKNNYPLLNTKKKKHLISKSLSLLSPKKKVFFTKNTKKKFFLRKIQKKDKDYHFFEKRNLNLGGVERKNLNYTLTIPFKFLVSSLFMYALKKNPYTLYNVNNNTSLCDTNLPPNASSST